MMNSRLKILFVCATNKQRSITEGKSRESCDHPHLCPATKQNQFLKTSGVLAVVLVFILCCHAVRADNGYSFGFSNLQVKYDSKLSRLVDDLTTTSHRGYKVSIENRSFKNLADVEFKYTIFAVIDNQPKRLEFETTVPLIKNGEKYILNTEPVELRRIESLGITDKVTSGKTEGVITRRWTQNDTLTGLWLRMSVNGAQIAEFFDPPALKEKANQ